MSELIELIQTEHRRVATAIEREAELVLALGAPLHELGYDRGAGYFRGVRLA